MPTAYPTDSQRVAMASLTRSESENFEGRQIAVYQDEATAAEAMAGFRRVLATCTVSTYVTAPLKIADDGLVVAGSVQSGTQVPGGGYYVLVRDGRSVYLASVAAEFIVEGPNDPPAAALVTVARDMLPLPQ